MGEKGKKMAEAHADFITRWYQEVFEHGYKHGYEDGRRDEAGKPRPEAETPYPLLRKWKDYQADEPDHDSEEGTLADSNTEVEKP